jgi:hypothetical protein
MNRALAELRQRAGHVGPGDFLALLDVAAGLLPSAARQHIEDLAYDGTTLTVTLRPSAAQQSAALLQELRGKAPPAGYLMTAQEGAAGGSLVIRLRERRGS